MVQKPLYKSGKKKPLKVPAANKHGRVQKNQKGKFQKPAKTAAAMKLDSEKQDITKCINRRIEEEVAAAAVHNGMRLSVVKPGKSAAETKQKSGKRINGQPK